MKNAPIKKPLFLIMGILSFVVFFGCNVLYFYDFSYFKNLVNGISILDLPNLLLALSSLISFMGLLGLIIGYINKDRTTLLTSSIILGACYFVGGSYQLIGSLITNKGLDLAILSNIYLLCSSICLLLVLINIAIYMSCFKAKKNAVLIILFSIFSLFLSLGSIILFMLGNDVFANFAGYFDFSSILSNDLPLFFGLFSSLLFSIGSLILYKKLY